MTARAESTAPSEDGLVFPGGEALILNAIPDAILVIDANNRICFANGAAEHMFDTSTAKLCQNTVDDLLPYDSPVLALVAQAWERGLSVAQYGVALATSKIEHQAVDVQVTVLAEAPGFALLKLQRRSIARKMDRLLNQRGAGRSVAGLAGVLAHEVKNPLSGIRGAAQLLEQSAVEDDKVLTQLICDETDRICALVDRMEAFNDELSVNRQAVNIYRVLERVRSVAEHGFARNIRFTENYDPSLPTVLGDQDQLIQVFLNLVKNAAEAASQKGGEIVISTAFRHGVRVSVPGTGNKMGLPIEISIQDNGGGIAEEIRPYLFEPFVSSKDTGSGLGLALAAKIIGDHGGIIDCDSAPGRTVFRVLLPMYKQPGHEQRGDEKRGAWG